MARILKMKVIAFIKKILLLIMKNVDQLRDDSNSDEHILVNLSHRCLRRPYLDGEKVDIVFIFQAASFWPSWESVWNACNEDEQFNPTMLVCDDVFNEKVQFVSAQNFLNKKKIPFRHISEVNLSDIYPHIVVLHTPYDRHRPQYLYGKMLASRGYRVAYITYGIEIADTDKARSDHFEDGVTTNAWRVYTFSSEMIPYYKLLSPTGGDMVRSFGHPKFDHLNKEQFPSLPNEIIKNSNGRKVVLWKVHFPKAVDGEMITPSLKVYREFLDSIKGYNELFFVFMPHPKFYEQLAKYDDAIDFKRKINELGNVFEFTEDDYRPVLINCDYYILDRSALMVEAGVTNRPILYISSILPEPMTKPVQKIIDTYYQASTFQEIKLFLNDIVLKDNDPLKKKRLETFNLVMPVIDGKSGYRIKDDMFGSLKNESDILNDRLGLIDK